MILDLLRDAFEDAKLPLYSIRPKKQLANLALTTPIYQLVKIIVCYSGKVILNWKHVSIVVHLNGIVTKKQAIYKVFKLLSIEIKVEKVIYVSQDC